MEIVKRYTPGSKILFASVALMDYVLAVCVYFFIVHYPVQTIPSFIVYHEVEGLMCVTSGTLLGMLINPTIIHRRRISLIDVFTRVVKYSVIQAMMIMIIIRLLTGYSEGVLAFGAWYASLYMVVILVSRCAERQLLNFLRKSGYNTRSVVFIGSDPANLYLYREMMSSPSIGYNVLGYYSNNKMTDAPVSLKWLGTRDEVVRRMRNGEQAFTSDVVFTSLSMTDDDDDINTIMNYCDAGIIQFYYVPLMNKNLNKNLTPLTVGDYTIFTNHTNNLNRLDNRIIKRMFDIVFSLIMCLIVLPFIPIIWIIVKVQSPGPLFFAQKRTGLNGETFVCYKFRSMHVNNDADSVQATKDDPRKFRFGEFMRRMNIDELPQFYNVLKGDMSVVGPRPHMLYHTEMYSEIISKYMVRHFSKPGITGWSQVTGYRGETKELWQMEERIKRDIWYNENWSFLLDLEIISRTIIQMLNRDEKAY